MEHQNNLVTTKKYGLIGYPLGHSFSEKYFSRKFELLGINDASYRLFPIADIALLPDLIRKEKLKGFTVTIPYKTAVIPLLNNISTEASQIGAVNTVCVDNVDGNISLTGHNTDAPAFLQTLKKLDLSAFRSALILGNGGASRAVAYVLKQLNISYKIVGRVAAKQDLSYDALTQEMIATHKLIINTTPLGMAPHTETFPDIPYHGITTEHIIYDLVYNPEQTRFMQIAEQQGAKVINGLEMLYTQADLAWNIWNP